MINGVTGPDEYSTVVDNNAYTNLMARENLREAVRAVEWLGAEHPERYARLVSELGLADEEVDGLAPGGGVACTSPTSPRSGSSRTRTSWSASAGRSTRRPPDHYPLLLHYHPLELYRHQVIKQADVVMAIAFVGR